ncbi:MAG: hypothetical protein U0270_11570 [Labilithrix sp.]
MAQRFFQAGLRLEVAAGDARREGRRVARGALHRPQRPLEHHDTGERLDPYPTRVVKTGMNGHREEAAHQDHGERRQEEVFRDGLDAVPDRGVLDEGRSPGAHDEDQVRRERSHHAERADLVEELEEPLHP